MKGIDKIRNMTIEEFADIMGEISQTPEPSCPDDMGLEGNCGCKTCKECWLRALNKEY